MSEEERRHVGVAEIPEDQRFSFRITPLPGRLLDLATVGGSMRALGRLHAALGSDINPKVTWKSCITGCELEADGSFRIDIAVLPASPAVEPQKETGFGFATPSGPDEPR